MNSRLLLLPVGIVLSLGAHAADVFFQARGTVSFIQSASGPYTGVQVGDAVRLDFKVTTPGTVISMQLQQFTVDPASVVLDVGMLSFAAGGGTPSMIFQNSDFGGSDGVRQFAAPLVNGAAAAYDFSAPNLFTSTDPSQNIGMWSPMFASYDCRIAGGGTYIEFTPTTLTILDSEAGTAYCFGDGTGSACPCGNASAVGARSGCLNSLALGGRLTATGIPSLASDSVVLHGRQMPNSSALYFQGSSQQNGGAGSVFGDGLRCAGGTVLRLGTKSNAAGESQYPAPGDTSTSVRGLVTAPGTRTYQVWYRNAAAFCTTSTFNLSNGLEIAWGA